MILTLILKEIHDNKPRARANLPDFTVSYLSFSKTHTKGELCVCVFENDKYDTTYRYHGVMGTPAAESAHSKPLKIADYF